MISFFKKTSFCKELELQGLEESTDFRELCIQYFIKHYSYKHFALTKSGTQSLELAFKAIDLPIGSEVILPSFSFVSIGNAITAAGLKCVFVDCEPNTMNISADAINKAISPSTKALVTINYGGVACDYDTIVPLCKENGIYLVEDNAHGIAAQYKGRNLGTFGDISTISFDYMKNISCDEGGGISINNPALLPAFKIAYEFGTNKRDFLEGKTDHYEWKGWGSNHALAQPLAAILFKQLRHADTIIDVFREKWLKYHQELSFLQTTGRIEMAILPEGVFHSAHMFWIKLADQQTRENLMNYLLSKGIQTAFHYYPLHSSSYGKAVGRFAGEDVFTTKDSARLLRLPLYYSLTSKEQECVINEINSFFL